MIEPTPVPRGEFPLSDVGDAPATASASLATDDVVLVVGGLDDAPASIDVDAFCDVARLVLAGVAARLDLPLGTIERLQTVLEELLRHQPEGSLVTIGFSCSDEELALRVAPLVVGLEARRRAEETLRALGAGVAWADSPHGVSVSARMSRPSLGRTTR